MILEQFTERDSFIHRLDPRVRIILGACFSITVAISHKFSTVIISLILSIAIIILAQLPLKTIIKRLAVINGLILLLWCFLPFTVKGRPMFNLGGFIITKEGIYYTLLITLKSNSIVLFLISTLSTMSIFTIGKALRMLYIPEKIIHLLIFTYRYIHVLEIEYQRLANAIKIRGFKPGNNLHTYRTYAYLIGMLIIKSYDRAKRVHHAMLCRGFKGRFYDLSQFSLRAVDLVWGFILLSIITIMGII